MPRTARHTTSTRSAGGPRSQRGGDSTRGSNVKGTRGASRSASTSGPSTRELAAPRRSKRSVSSSSPSAFGPSKTSAQTVHPLASEEASVMSKSKSSAAAVVGNERSRGNAALHPMTHPVSGGSSKSTSRGSAHAKQDPPPAAEAAQDEDFDGETPAIGSSTQTAEVELIEEEFDLETPPVDGAADRDSP